MTYVGEKETRVYLVAMLTLQLVDDLILEKHTRNIDDFAVYIKSRRCHGYEHQKMTGFPRVGEKKYTSERHQRSVIHEINTNPLSHVAIR